MNQNHARATTKAEIIEITFYVSDVKHLSFTLMASKGKISWGDEATQEISSCKPLSVLEPIDNKYSHDYYSTSNKERFTIRIEGFKIVGFNVDNQELVKITCIDCEYMVHFNCTNCSLHELKFVRSAVLYILCRGNKLKKLDLSTIRNLMILNCDSNYLKNLNLSFCNNIYKFSCQYNRIQDIKLPLVLERFHEMKLSFNELNERKIGKLFDHICTFVGNVKVDVDYAFNPGTKLINMKQFPRLSENDNKFLERTFDRMSEYAKYR